MKIYRVEGPGLNKENLNTLLLYFTRQMRRQQKEKKKTEKVSEFIWNSIKLVYNEAIFYTINF